MQQDLRVYTNDNGEVTAKELHTGGTGDLKSFDPKSDRILAYTNQRVIELNNLAATHLGLPAEISKGEDILLNNLDAVMASNSKYMMLWPGMISKGRLMDSEELAKARIKIERDIAKWGTEIPYPQTSVEVNNDYYTVYYDYDHYATSQRLKKAVYGFQDLLVSHHRLAKDVHIPTWCKENRGSKWIKERNKAWADYLNHQNYVFDIRRPFATTVHKSQGSEFGTVFIDQENMKLSIRNGYVEQYARLMYVAMSRAINKVVIL